MTNSSQNTNDLNKIFVNELSSINSSIERYDAYSFIIKGWAITLWIGLVYLAYNHSLPQLFFIQIVILLVFWSFDGLYKFFQRSFAIRSSQIRKFFENYRIKINKNKLEIKPTIKNYYEQRNSIPFINPRGNFESFIFNKQNTLRRSLVIRVVSCFYIYLITASFALSILTDKELSDCCTICFFCCLIYYWVNISTLMLFLIGVVNFIRGWDDKIEGVNYKKNKLKKLENDLIEIDNQISKIKKH